MSSPSSSQSKLTANTIQSSSAMFTVGSRGLLCSNSSRTFFAFSLVSHLSTCIEYYRLCLISLCPNLLSHFLPHRFRSFSLLRFVCKPVLSRYSVSLIDINSCHCSPTPSERRIYYGHCYLARYRDSNITKCALIILLSFSFKPATDKSHSKRPLASVLEPPGGG